MSEKDLTSSNNSQESCSFRKAKRQRTHSVHYPRSKTFHHESATASVVVSHYPSSHPFPVVMSDDFPSEPYRSRNKEVKSSIHWGQRKLIISEIQFLSLYALPKTAHHIVYVGSAPGTHIAFLDDMFDRQHTWELIDPGQFDRETLGGRRNIWMRNEFCTNALAYGINARRIEEHYPALAALYRSVSFTEKNATPMQDLHEKLQDQVGSMDVARVTVDIPSMYEPLLDMPRGLELLCLVGMERAKPLLFISDIRTGNVSMPNFEEHVAENMRAQESWTRILQAEYSMLKFRLPYTKIAKTFGGRDVVEQKQLIQDDGTVMYLRGDILLPVWTRPTSTEGRLVVPKGAFQIPYRVQKIEDQFFFFNTRVREQMHFNHHFVFHPVFNHHFDPAAEIHCLLGFIKAMKPESKDWDVEVLHKEVQALSDHITEHLGINFNDAICRRDAVMLKQAEQGYSAHTSSKTNNDNDASTDTTKMDNTTDTSSSKVTSSPSAGKTSAWYNATKRLIDLAWKERERPLWSVNADENKWNEPSGLWVTTKMPQ